MGQGFAGRVVFDLMEADEASLQQPKPIEYYENPQFLDQVLFAGSLSAGSSGLCWPYGPGWISAGKAGAFSSCKSQGA